MGKETVEVGTGVFVCCHSTSEMEDRHAANEATRSDRWTEMFSSPFTSFRGNALTHFPLPASSLLAETQAEVSAGTALFSPN